MFFILVTLCFFVTHLLLAFLQDLKISVEDKVATFTFNRPDKFNALSGKLIQSAKEHLQEFAVDPAVGVIVLTGAGRAFCAGGDVSSMAWQDQNKREQ